MIEKIGKKTRLFYFFVSPAIWWIMLFAKIMNYQVIVEFAKKD